MVDDARRRYRSILSRGLRQLVRRERTQVSYFARTELRPVVETVNQVPRLLRDDQKMRSGEDHEEDEGDQIDLSVDIDGTGKSDCKTGVKFLDHMLDSFATHSLVDLRVRAKGDLQHHIVEDVALALGQALSRRSATGRG